MLSRSQVVLAVALGAWLLVALKLYAMRAGGQARRSAPPSPAAETSTPDFQTGASAPTTLALPSQSAAKGASVTAPIINISPAVPSVRQSTSVDTPTLSVTRTANDYSVRSIPWMDFVKLPHDQGRRDNEFPPIPSVHTCSQDVIDKVDARLVGEDLKWCQWALSDAGGKVKVGRSYGTLNGGDREKYEQLNCNAVAKGENPSCNDAWGDNHVTYWKKNAVPDLCGGQQYSSKVRCVDSANLARFCEFDNVMLDLSKMHNVKRAGRSDSRKWDAGFLSTHCDPAKTDINYYDFYAPQVDAKAATCDFVMNETVVIYGHDDIHNLGHSMSDFMNVWTMLWLSTPSRAAFARHITFLNADAIRMGHNYYDELGAFAPHYLRQFARVLKLSAFPAAAKVCVKHLVFMPRPLVLFTWDGWWQDMRCSFQGPSALFQRWNMQVRKNYGLLPHQLRGNGPTAAALQVLLVLRKSRTGTTQQTTRVIKNGGALEAMIRALPGVNVTAVDLSSLPFEAQVRAIAHAHIMVGMHGAGISSSMHMNIGGDNCCGVVEIFPVGEFKPIRGYGNMARRMGHHYERLELSSADSHSDGAVVNEGLLRGVLESVIERVRTRPTCVMPTVLSDPYFEK